MRSNDAFSEITKSFGTGADKLLKVDLEKYKKKLKRTSGRRKILLDLAKTECGVREGNPGAKNDEAAKYHSQPSAASRSIVQIHEGSAHADRVPAYGA
jgi:hypothetical protein